MQSLNVVWFRNDLRCYDNACLSSAVEFANRTGNAVIGIFIATPDTWQLHDMAPIKQDLVRRRVKQLQTELQQINIPLLAIEGSTYDAVPEVFCQLAKQFKLHVFLHENSKKPLDISCKSGISKNSCERGHAQGTLFLWDSIVFLC